jgi:hypothetical protein
MFLHRILYVNNKCNEREIALCIHIVKLPKHVGFVCFCAFCMIRLGLFKAGNKISRKKQKYSQGAQKKRRC